MNTKKNIQQLYLVVILLLTCLELTAQTEVTLYTPNGSEVKALILGEMSESDISFYTNEYKKAYPQAEVLANASQIYNCHSYAWNLSERGETVCWLNQYPDLHKYWDDNSYQETTEYNAEKIFYYRGDHSAVKSQITGKYESKWGAMPLMRHAPEYGPTIYKMRYRRYYKKTKSNPPTNLTATNIRYKDFILNWTGTEGATAYEVYDVTGGFEHLLGTATETQFIIDNLEMGETYEYAVKAKYQNAVSEYSDTLSVTTVKLNLLGATTICDQEVYTIENLLPNTEVKWSPSNSNLELVSVTENGKRATFSKKGNGLCWVSAHLKDVKIVLHKEIMVGTPLASEIEVYMNGQTLGKLPPYLLTEFDFPKLKLDPYLVTLCTSKNNLFYAKYPKSLFNSTFMSNEFVEFIDFKFINLEYEWRVKEGVYSWLIEPKYPFFIGFSNNSIVIARYVAATMFQPYDYTKPAFEVRLCNECGCSEWKELNNFEVKECSVWDLIFLLTPNGDGVNDTFEITETAKPNTYSTTTTDHVYNLTIFNNEGNVVYAKDNYMQDDERFVGIGNTGNYANVTLSGGNYYYTLTGSSNRSGTIYLERE